MATWREFLELQPEIAQSGRSLFYQVDVGLGFLATVRPDGGPRLHPMCPIIDAEGLYALIIPSPKREDLIRDGRYALHSFPFEGNEDAFYLTGTARVVEGAEVRARVTDQFMKERKFEIPQSEVDAETLFEFDIQSALLTRTTGYGDFNPRHTVWRAAAGDVN